jgi:hypothetical protein
MQGITLAPARSTAAARVPLLLPEAALDRPAPAGRAPLRVRILKTAAEREAISRLRRHAAFGVEQDLGLGLKDFEQMRDDVGLVTAVYRDEQLLASLRLVPTGYGLTGAERLFEQVPFDSAILREGSWEAGRMIMEPEDRDPVLLHQCICAMLQEVMRIEDVRHFHGTTTMLMARLWRRLGFRPVLTAHGASGTPYALLHARVDDVAGALHRTHYVDEPAAAPAARQPVLAG